jgi:Domain of unknown function (DUF4160)
MRAIDCGELGGCDRLFLTKIANCQGIIDGYLRFRKAEMPEVARFYGISIKIFFGDHPPPHFHAVYGEYNALVGIESLKVIEGDLPNRAEKLVLEWAGKYQNELMEMWNLQEFCKLPPLK